MVKRFLSKETGFSSSPFGGTHVHLACQVPGIAFRQIGCPDGLKPLAERRYREEGTRGTSSINVYNPCEAVR